MSDNSNIEWTDATWNPLAGCSLKSPGCTHCYAMPMAHRIQLMSNANGRNSHYDGTTKLAKGKPVWTGKINLAPEHVLKQPLSWRRPRRIFVNSMSDLFHEDVPSNWIDEIFAVMSLCPQHIFQILTKRPQRMFDYLSNRSPHGDSDICAAINRIPSHLGDRRGALEMPLPNVWLGVSVEDQRHADERIPFLLNTPAAIRFLSCEPLLGPVDLDCVPWPEGWRSQDDEVSDGIDPLRFERANIDWVIVGGESGPRARPMHPDWVRSIRNQCRHAGVPFFFKQWGEWTPGENVERMTGFVQSAHWFGDGWSFGRENLAFEDGHIDDQPDLYRVGKKHAGRHLDGEIHDAFPSAIPAAA